VTTAEIASQCEAEADQFARDFYEALNESSRTTERAVQAGRWQAGISDLGFCSERVRRMLDKQVPDDSDEYLAWIGTALGDHAEAAALKRWPDAIRQAEVSVRLAGDQATYTLAGHPDLVFPEGRVIDVKTDYGLTDIRRTGPTQQQQFQRHLYGLGAFEAGLFYDDVTLDDVRVGNVWIDRAGIERSAHAQIEPFNPDYVGAATEWLDDVVYAYLHHEEARKEPPRNMCEQVCGFFQVCRLYDTDVAGRINDPDTLRNIEMYQEGASMERDGKRLKDEAKRHLAGVEGSTGEYMIRWVHVNAQEMGPSFRSAHDKLDIRKVKR
jgi:hypothetical protein